MNASSGQPHAARNITLLLLAAAAAFAVVWAARMFAAEPQTPGPAGAERFAEVNLDAYPPPSVTGVQKVCRREDASGMLTGYRVEVLTNGYHGAVRTRVDFDPTGKVVYSVGVIAQAETEGIGSRIAAPEFLGRFAGLSAPLALERGRTGTPSARTLTSAGHKAAPPAEGMPVDALAGATASSQAVVNGVNTAYTFLSQYLLAQ